MDELNCPFCNKKMTIKKESGFLGSEYLECNSCEVSFTKSGKENLHLKDFKEKTFLEKHKYTHVPYEEWIKIGQGEYTKEEIKEQSELEFVEKLEIKCPTCDTNFNKYHKKGILSFDSIICPECNARYEILSSLYKFKNIPDINSKLWEHYDENLTISQIYAIFGKEDELDTENLSNQDNPNVFECEITEGTVGLTSERNNERYKAVVTLHKDYLEITKGSYWRNKDRGSKELLYNKITSVDLDIGGFLGWNAVELTLSGSELVCLMNVNKKDTTDFYNHLKEIIRKYNLNNEKQNNTPSEENTATSDADELMKWHQLKEQGIITEEEFEIKKKQLLGI